MYKLSYLEPVYAIQIFDIISMLMLLLLTLEINLER